MVIAFDVRVLKNKCTTGIEEYTSQLLSHLLEKDRKNTYILFYVHTFSIDEKLRRYLKYPNVRVKHIRFSNKILSLIWKFFRFPSLEWLLGEHIDVVFCPHINIVQAQKAHTCVVVHDLAFLKFPHCFTYWKLFWHLYMANESLPQADTLFAVSQQTKLDIQYYYGIDERKIFVLYPGSTSNMRHFSQEEKEIFRNTLNLPERYILFMGTLEPRKNVENLVSAFGLLKQKSSLQNLKLVLTGKKGWLYNGIFRKIKELHLEGEVYYHSYISNEQKNTYLACAEAFIYPSLYEGFGFPPLEALQAGTSVIYGNCPSLMERAHIKVDETRLIQLTGTDVLDIFEAMIRFFSRKRKKNGEKLRQLWSWEATATNLLYHLCAVKEQ